MIRRPPRSTLFPTTLFRSRRIPPESNPAKSLRWKRLTLNVFLCPSKELLELQWQRKTDRKSTRLNSSHTVISYAVFCLKKKKNIEKNNTITKKTIQTEPER